MRKPAIMSAVTAIVLAYLAGCVVVNPSNVSVSGFGSPTPRKVKSPEMEKPYADLLRKVDRQQDHVAHELNKGDWDEVADEAGDWVEYTRELSSYADRSHDPAKFRQYAGELLAATQQVRSAATRRDAYACRQAINRCDPILNRFFRDFPLTVDPHRPTPRQTTRSGHSANPPAVDVTVRVP